ncbi:unnamed protein product [Fusarium graminearum]|uniref:Chromosome 1, complete genome n=1 Tax=Gibberella zeae (strain ATCC MYA-4620 / CBS 123657 / FGSC 9075 / NRRL 31084 / PH-1) TaxID=229533 RepID=A0A098D7S2_GIBZE|nr:unnamed protein product [Fusarium graminearum]CZS77753.1 unnamed protein product [Fusarium graminearum]
MAATQLLDIQSHICIAYLGSQSKLSGYIGH